MYWTLIQVLIVTFAPVLPMGTKITRVDPAKYEWVFSFTELKSPYALAREVYLEQKAAYKVE
jgi:hypothetical protein